MTGAQPRLGGSVFIAFLALYVLSTHGHVSGMGYEAEPYATAKQLVEHGDVSLYGSGIAGKPKSYGRNDLTQPLMMAPFYLVARLLPRGTFGDEWAMALFSPLVSAIIVWLIYRFAVGLSGSPRTAVLIAILGGVGTMLWPYAVIGMEPVQTFLCLAAAWLTYRFRQLGSPMHLVGAALAIALLFQAKRASPILIPPLLLYVGYVVLERRRGGRVATVLTLGALASLLAVSVAVSIWLNSKRHLDGGAVTQLAALTRNGWLPAGLYGFLFSAGKSLFLYNPSALLGLLTFPAFYRRHRPEAVLFAALVSIPYVFFSMFRWWGEETWGPRYLHVTVPFVLLFLTGSDWSQLWSHRRRIALMAALGVGAAVQVLGLLFWYGEYHTLLNAAKLNTLEGMQYDPRLSHLWINLRLAWSTISMHILGRPVFLDYAPQYWFTAPPEYQLVAQPRHIDLQPFARIGLWFPATLANPHVPMLDRLLTAALAVLLLVILVRAASRIWQVCRPSDDGGSSIRSGSGVVTSRPTPGTAPRGGRERTRAR